MYDVIMYDLGLINNNFIIKEDDFCYGVTDKHDNNILNIKQNLEVKQTKGNVPINNELLNKYASVREIFNNVSNNDNEYINLQESIAELDSFDM